MTTDFLFDFARTLPKKYVGANRRTKHTRDDEQKLKIKRNMRHKRIVDNFTLRLLNEQCGNWVGEKRKRQPLQEFSIRLIVDKHLKASNEECHNNTRDLKRHWRHKLHRRCYRTNISTDIDRVRITTSTTIE